MANIAPAVTTASTGGNSLLTSIVSVTITVTSSASAAASPSSTTSPGSIAAPEKCESCDEFTRANLVGVFITLILCLLTQPSGSLYYRGHGGFFWRINPFASFVEASIIFWYLGLAVWDVVVKKKKGRFMVPGGEPSGDDDEAPLLETLLREGDHESSTDDARPTAESGEAGPGPGLGGSSEGGRNESDAASDIELQESAPACSGANPDAPDPQSGPSQADSSHPTGVEASTPGPLPVRKSYSGVFRWPVERATSFFFIHYLGNSKTDDDRS
ncbi:hypothetical protein V8F06_013724 [Rhypophila decipiens]